MVTQPKSDVMQIDEERDGDTRIVFSPISRDRFVRTGRQVIEACELKIGVELWLKELTEVTREIIVWCRQRRDRIGACFCVPKGSHVTFFFVPVGDAFDFDLADDLVKLSQSLRKYNVGHLEFLQIPRAELDRFLDVDQATRLYGQPDESHSTVDA